MSHAKNKTDWCLKKARKELEKSDKHRGLIKITPNKVKARKHIKKAEHYLSATIYLKKGDYSDISASTIFYCIYQCLLAIAIKHGYESRNQECTFALIYKLIEDGLELDKEIMNNITSLNPNEKQDQTTINLRELYQYGTSLTLKDNLYEEQLLLAKKILALTKELIEKQKTLNI